MRKIEIYQIQQAVVVGSTFDLDALAKKLAFDTLLMQQIESDYNSNEQEFKTEYISAKTNHLKNKWLYCWLYLDHYFGIALLSTLNTQANAQKEEMKKAGWIFPPYFIDKHIATSHNANETFEDAYIRMFNKLFDLLFNININHFISDISEKDARANRYYHQAIGDYKNENYYACAVSLFPIIEFLHKRLTNFDESTFYKIKDNLNTVSNKIDDVKQPYVSKISYYSDLIKQFNHLALNHYFNSSFGTNDEPVIINRNRIMHGIFTREVSQKDCLQLFCVISNMVLIKSIIDVDQMMRKISQELEEIKQSNE